jgi:hypothetical protein
MEGKATYTELNEKMYLEDVDKLNALLDMQKDIERNINNRINSETK